MRISDWSSDVCSSDLLGVRGDRAGLGQNLATLDFFTADAADQRTDVVAGLTLVEQLAEHLNPGHDGLLGVLRSEEHTSELQSLMRISYAVFCLKKKTTIASLHNYHPFYSTEQPLYKPQEQN